MGSVPGLGRSPGGGHGNPLQYSCLENPVDRGAWRAMVHRVAKSWTRLKQLSIITPIANTEWFVKLNLSVHWRNCCISVWQQKHLQSVVIIIFENTLLARKLRW